MYQPSRGKVLGQQPIYFVNTTFRFIIYLQAMRYLLWDWLCTFSLNELRQNKKNIWINEQRSYPLIRCRLRARRADICIRSTRGCYRHMLVLSIPWRFPRVVLVMVEIGLFRRRPGCSVRVWLGLRLLLLRLLLLLVVLIVLRPVVRRMAKVQRGQLLLLLLLETSLEWHYGNDRGSLDPVWSFHRHYPRFVHVTILLRLFPV